MKPKSKWFWYWMGWLALFLVPEGIALFNGEPGDTLSESIWFLQQRFWGLTIVLLGLFVFLFYHFIIDKRSRK